MASTIEVPRLVVAGPGGDAGKTLVSLALAKGFAARGLDVRAFKKGPDYIDAAWLTWAAGRAARNLDTFLTGRDAALASFARQATTDGINLVEGNRGLFDGVDGAGTHSTAELAKLIDAPVVLVLNATKVTRTLAALVLGCQLLDPELRIAGVILNRVAGPRHEAVIREAIQSTSGVPVLGAVSRLTVDALLPARHLGLVTPEEHGRLDELGKILTDQVAAVLDLEEVETIARTANPIERLGPRPRRRRRPAAAGRSRPVIGYLLDSAFSFYYPENLEALEAEGATLLPISALAVDRLPDGLDGLYIGGGFPETHAATLSANRPFLESLAARARAGLPIYAECGGLMLLSEAIRWNGQRHPLAGVLPFEVELQERPAGHGYVELAIDVENLWFAVGERVRGHEFHYSRIVADSDRAGVTTAAAVQRGTGSVGKRDGFVVRNVWASYTHLHALGCPAWARAFLALVVTVRSA